jgi:hypothetical protein
MSKAQIVRRYIFWCFALWLLYEATGYVLVYLAPSSSYGYAIKYSVNPSSVFIDRRPHDCEYETAPLGNKNCHYDAKVTSVRTSQAADGTGWASYDEGKTWVINTFNSTPGVSVLWSKIDE